MAHKSKYEPTKQTFKALNFLDYALLLKNNVARTVFEYVSRMEIQTILTKFEHILHQRK